MALKRTRKSTFSADVTVFTPNDKCGHDRSTFIAKFRSPSTAELDELKKLPQPDMLRKVLVCWDGFQDDDGNELDFNDENIESLLSIIQAVLGLSTAFWESVIKLREKN